MVVFPTFPLPTRSVHYLRITPTSAVTLTLNIRKEHTAWFTRGRFEKLIDILISEIGDKLFIKTSSESASTKGRDKAYKEALATSALAEVHRVPELGMQFAYAVQTDKIIRHSLVLIDEPPIEQQDVGGGFEMEQSFGSTGDGLRVIGKNVLIVPAPYEQGMTPPDWLGLVYRKGGIEDYLQ